MRIRALQIRCTAQKVVVKRLRTYLAVDGEKTREYNDAMHTLNWKVNTLTTWVEKLDGTARRAEELEKVNFILTAKMTSLQESVDKAKANAVKEFKDSQPFFDLLGSQYGEGFEDFYKQVILVFSSVDLSSIQINTTIPMSPRGDDEVIDIEDGEDEEAFGGEALAPWVTQGDNPPQLEGPTEDKTDLAPTT